jgi:hypothetical protein
MMSSPMANPMVNSNNNLYNNNFSALSSNQTQFVSNPYNNFGYSQNQVSSNNSNQIKSQIHVNNITLNTSTSIKP